TMNVNIDIEPGAENVFAEKVVLVRFFDRALQDLRTFRKLASYIYVRRPGTERETRDGDAFQQLMRIFVDDVAVLERARLRFVRIANQIDRLLLVRLDETPLYATGKSGAATAPQTRRLHLVHHANRRGAAACQTFDKLDAQISVSADGNRCVYSVTGSLALNPSRGAEIFHDLITSSHRATERAANANVRFAGAFLAQHRVEGDQLENVDRLESELGRDPGHGVIIDEIEMFLPKMQQRQGRASFFIGRIMPNRFIHSSLQLGGN